MIRIRLIMLLLFVTLGSAGGVARSALGESGKSKQPAEMPTQPKAARVQNIVDKKFGLTMPDPYRWMEGENNKEFSSWIKEQGAYGRAQLDALPKLGYWRTQLKDSGNFALIRKMVKVAGLTFYTYYEKGNTGVLIVQDAAGNDRVLLDPNKNNGSGATSITNFSPSPDGKLVAVNIDRAGTEIATITLIDTNTGATLPDVINNIWGDSPALWLPDGKSFTYLKLASAADQVPGDKMQKMRDCLHRLGTDANVDPVVLAAGLNKGLNIENHDFPTLDATSRSDWIIAYLQKAVGEERVCVTNKKNMQNPGASWKCISSSSPIGKFYALHGSTLYLISYKGAPNGQVLKFNLDQQGHNLGKGDVVMPEASDTVVDGIELASDAVYVWETKNNVNQLARIPLKSGKPEMLTMPFQGAGQFAADKNQSGALLTLQGWIYPLHYFWFDPAAREFKQFHAAAIGPDDYHGLAVNEVLVKSADGTMVPLTIIYARDLKRNGKAMAILHVAGVRFSIKPYFFPTFLEWVKAGNIYAFTHVRSDGGKGRISGASSVSLNTQADDIIASGKYLQANGYADSSHTAVLGTYDGGIPVARAIEKNPQQFAAAVLHDVTLNPVRIMSGPSGANTASAFGDPQTEAGLKTLEAIDPYLQLKNGTPYPSVLIYTPLNESRIPSWHSGKFGARLMASSTSGKPVLFRTGSDQGFVVSSLGEVASEFADIYAFIESQAK